MPAFAGMTKAVFEAECLLAYVIPAQAGIHATHESGCKMSSNIHVPRVRDAGAPPLRGE